jgi:hypothetical protein
MVVVGAIWRYVGVVRAWRGALRKEGRGLLKAWSCTLLSCRPLQKREGVEEEIASQPARGEREKRWMGQFLACLRSHNLDTSPWLHL